jgi:hypothetical protein
VTRPANVLQRKPITRCGIALAAAIITLGLAAHAAGVESYERVSPGVQQQMEEARAKLVSWLEQVDAAVFPPGKFLAKDQVVLTDGTTLSGKILDYGPYVCLVDATKRTVLPRGKIQKMTASWGDAAPSKPNVPDLDVTYIERLPRYRSNHGNVAYDPKEKGVYLPKPNDDPVWPPEGTKATFKGHVVNKGPVASKPFAYEWLIDGTTKAKGTHAALDPREETVIDFTWVWQDGPHDVTLKVLPDGNDFSAWNNRHTDRTDSLGLSFAAAQSTYDGFDGVLNMVESYSYEDWLQYHLQVMNFLFAASIHPGSPLGCLERVRVDQMATFPDEGYAEQYGRTGLDEHGYAYHEGRWGFSPWDQYESRGANIDWGLIHELGHQLGIIDYYTLDFWRYSIFARDKNGDLIDVGFSYPYTGMMRGHGPHAFTEVTAVALNLERGKHRGYFGDYLFNVPKECGLRILAFNGKPLADAEVRIFRRLAGVHTEDTGMIRIPEDPVFTGTTDADGVFMLPNEQPPFVFTTENGFTRGPSPFGDALVISDTGLMLIEIWKNGRRDAQFTDVTEFVKGRGRGYADKYLDDIETILPADDDAVKPPRILGVVNDGWCDRLKLSWVNVEGNTAVQFRIYQALDGLPFQRRYMTELATVNAQGPFAMSVVHLNGWVTMTGVDAAGNESAPAEPVYVGWRYFGKLDVNARGDVFVGDGTVERIDGADVVHPVPLRSARGYWPATAVAAGPEDRLLVLSRDSAGVCVFEPDGRQMALFGAKGAGDGQLDQPSDLDLDASGNVYIADTNNNRIVVFGPDGTFVANAGAGKIEKPVAVEVDGSGNLYIIQSQKPGLVKIPKAGNGYGDPVAFAQTQGQPWDVTSDANGRIYVAQDAEPGLLIFAADGSALASVSAWNSRNLRGISGLAFDRRGLLVCSMHNLGVIFRVPVNELVAIPQ